MKNSKNPGLVVRQQQKSLIYNMIQNHLVCQQRSTNYYADSYSQDSVMIEVWKHSDCGGDGVQSVGKMYLPLCNPMD